MSQDTIHRLFLNVNALLDFQRHFLIAMEGIFEQKWPDQRWGSIFINHVSFLSVSLKYIVSQFDLATGGSF
jgi:cell division control protein 24